MPRWCDSRSRDGRTVTFESNNSSSPPAYDIGEKVTVIYPTDKPEKAIIKGEGVAFRIIFTSIGAIIILFGLVMFGKNLKDSYYIRLMADLPGAGWRWMGVMVW